MSGVSIGDPDGVRLYIGPLPERKNEALCMIDHTGIRPLAYFKSRQKADDAKAFVWKLAGSRIVEDAKP